MALSRAAIILALVPLSAAFAQLDHPAPGQPVIPPTKVTPAVPIKLPTVQPPVKPEEPQPAKQAKLPIYDEKADARAQIAAAMNAAGKENRRVLIQWGGNWCGWCHLLHDLFKSDRALAKELMYEYDLVLVDAGREGKNIDLARTYKADIEKGGFPFLTVLDPAGNVIANQETGSLESKTPEGKPTEKPGHDSAKVLAFLQAHKAKPLAADSVLKSGRDSAKSSGKQVFLHFGAPWCGWCKKLDAWLAREDVAALFSKDYVDVKIDQDRMTGAKEVFAQYKKDYNKTGIPWFVIVDAGTGEPLSTSDGTKPDATKGNIGFPAEDHEIAHFVTMLKATAKKMSDSDILALKATLEEGRKK